MKKGILLFIFTSAFTLLFAQKNYCSEAKSGYKAYQPLSKTNGGTAETLMNKYDVKFYHLNLNLERTSTYISGWVRSISKTIAPLDSFAFELYTGLSLDSVFSGTQKLVSSHNGNFGYAKFPSTIATGSTIDMKVYYHGTPPTPGSAAIGAGFTNATDGTSGSQITYSLTEPYSAEEWWPCKQSLQDKIDSSYVFVTTDSTNKVGSNGVLKNVVVVGNKKRYEWKEINIIDYYLISVAVGKYYDYSFYANPVNTPPILIQNYIYDVPATISAMKPIFDNTKPIMELYCKLFGPYAFANEKYGHSMAPLSGGMEHQTMTTIGVINYEVVAHELGHQWFGDEVTCATWNDIWLNESFATYTAYLAYQYLDTTKAPAYMTGSHNTAMGAPNGSVWCTDTTSVGRIFSNQLSYQKGSSMIHMIRYELGNDTLFFNVLKEYLRRFKGSTASSSDFKKVLEDISGRDFTQFLKQWLYGEGYPTFNVFWNQKGNTFSILNAEATSFPSSISLYITPVDIKIKTVKGDTIFKMMMNKNVQGRVFTIKDSVLSVQVDPYNWLLCKSAVIKDPNLTTLGIDANAGNHSIVFYPNPAHDKLTIQAFDIQGEIPYEIIDATGRIVLQGMLTHEFSDIDILGLNTGLYILKTGDNVNSVLKFIKN